MTTTTIPLAQQVMVLRHQLTVITWVLFAGIAAALIMAAAAGTAIQTHRNSHYSPYSVRKGL
jgi:hypothetical protein